MARILVVDDHPLNRNLLKTILGYARHEVIEAGDGAEALDLVRSQPFDLIISDILMPTMDGVAFVQALRADPRFDPIIVIFYTATYRLHEARRIAESCGVLKVLAKPSEPEIILETVHACLGLTAVPLSPPFIQDPRAGELQQFNAQVTTIVAQGTGFAGSGDPEVITGTLGHLERMALRLSAVLEASMDLGLERDPQAMVALFCRQIRGLVTSRFAVLGIGEDPEAPLVHLKVHGLPAAQWEPFTRHPQFFRCLMRERKVCHVTGPWEPAHWDLPPGHPACRSLLAIPVSSLRCTYGWVYLADRIGAETFSEEDEQLASTLASHFAVAYENLRLVEDLQAQLRGRVHAEEALQKAATQLQNVFNNVDVVLWSYDVETGRMLEISPACESIYGLPPQAFFDHPRLLMSEAVHADDRPLVARQVEDLLKGIPILVEHRILRRDGSLRWILVRANAQRDSRGLVTRIHGAVSDITESRRTKERMVQQERLAALGTLVGTVAHDIRNPLMLMTSAAEQLADEIPDDERYRHLLAVLGRASGRITVLVDDLLDFGRPRPLHPRSVIDQALLREAMESCASAAAKGNVRVELQAGGNVPRLILDPDRMHQVLRNILENAIQHSPANGRVRMASSFQEGSWTCTVEDEGPGLTDEDLPRVFDPFFTNRSGGTGLGLAIAHRIVQLHNGELYAANRPSGGALFTLRLPMAP